MNRWFLILFACLFFAGNVLALGIAPARRTLDFEPGLKTSVSFSIVNSNGENLSLSISKKGELAQYVTLNGKDIFLSSGENDREYSYEVELPQELGPGLHTADIVVAEEGRNSGVSRAYVGARVAVVAQLYVNVPYPGKFADASLNIINAVSGGDAIFIMPVVSKGKLDLASVRANVDIYNNLNEKVGSFDTDEISVASGTREELVSRWKADVPVGVYRAQSTLIYDGKAIELDGQFNVGSEILKLQQIKVRNFKLGEIAKFEMLVENKWSEPIVGLYSQVNLFDESGNIIADFKSPTYDVKPLSKYVLVLYWDTAGFKEGTYDADIYLKYGEKSFDNNLKFEIFENKIEIIGLGYVISEKQKGFFKDNIIMILAGMIVLLILINLVWFVILRRKFFGNRNRKARKL